MPRARKLAAALLLGGIVLAVVAACGPTAKQIAQDKQGQPMKVARGTVAGKNFTPESVQMMTSYTQYGPMTIPITTPASYKITFAFDGISKTIDNQEQFNRFQQGQEVEVAYVRGRSGTLYLNAVTPLEPPKPPPVFNYVIMEEFFDAKKNIAEAQTYKIYADAGKLNLWSSDYQNVYIPLSLDHTKDFMVEAEMKRVSGGTENKSYGLIVGRDPGNTLTLLITDTKLFSVALFTNGQERNLKDWTPSSAIQDGPDRLGIARKDGVTSFLINGQVVFRDAGAALPGGNVGFTVNKAMTITADNLRIQADDRPMDEEAEVVEQVMEEPAPARAAQGPEAQLKLLLDAGLISQEEYQAKLSALRARSAPKPDPETAAKIESLKTLRDAGLLTEEEYKDKMRSLTGGP